MSIFLNYKPILVFSKTTPRTHPIKTGTATSVVILITNYNLKVVVVFFFLLFLVVFKIAVGALTGLAQ